mgnify:CR=1 FL=1
MEALDYDDIVLINAPFTQEVRDNAFIADLKAKLAAKGATLAVIWVETSPRSRPPANDRAQLGPRHLEAGSLG